MSEGWKSNRHRDLLVVTTDIAMFSRVDGVEETCVMHCVDG